MNDTKLTYSNISDFLISKIPEFEQIVEEHVEDNQKVLPHVLFGDFTRFFISTYKKSKQSIKDKEVLDSMLNVIEFLTTINDDQISELLNASFFENLHQAGEDYDEIKRVLKPNSFKELIKKEVLY